LESIPAASGEQVKREFARTPAARPWCLKLIRNLAIPEPVSVWLTGKQELRLLAIIRAMTRISRWSIRRLHEFVRQAQCDRWLRLLHGRGWLLFKAVGSDKARTCLLRMATSIH